MLRILLLFFLLVLTLNAHVLRVGYSTDAFSELSKRDSKLILGLWFEDIMKSVKHSATFAFYDDIAQMADDFNNNNRLDLVFANGFEFVKYFNISKMQNAFTGASEDKNANNLVEIKQKSIALNKLRKKKILRVSLLKGENPSSLYVSSKVRNDYLYDEVIYTYTKKYSAAILKLFFNQTDIIVVPKKTFEFAKELNPQIAARLEVVHQTDINLGTLGYFHKNIDEAFRQEVIRLAFKESETQKGRQRLLIFKTPKLVEVDLQELYPIEKLYKKYLRQMELEK